MHPSLLALPFVLAIACTETSSTSADLSCIDEQSLTLSRDRVEGLVLDEVGGAPISGALIELLAADGSPLANAASDQTGAYAISAPDGVHRHAMAEGYLDAYAYAVPFAGEPEPLPMLTRAGAEQLARDAGVALDPAKGMLLVVALDCAGHPVQGAKIHVPNADAVVYLGPDTHFDPTRTSTSSDSAAFVFGVPVGQIDVEIEIDGVTYGSTVESRANALVTRWERP